MTWLKYDGLFDLVDKGAKIGKHVRIDSSVVIINPEDLKVDDYSRIDAFVFISGIISIGRFCHVSPFVVLSGSETITLGECVGLSGQCYLFTNSADFKNESLSLPTIPNEYKRKKDRGSIIIGNHCILGGGSKVFPNTEIKQGCKFGVNSIIKGRYESWGLNISNNNKVAKRICELRSDIITIDYQKLLDKVYPSK